MKIEKLLKLFFTLILVLIISLNIIGYIWSRVVVENVNKQVCENYSEEIQTLTESTFNGLKRLVEDFASDPQIIKLIEENGNYRTKEEEIKTHIKYAEGLVNSTSFVEDIDVVDNNEMELYSSKGYYAEFDMKSRPWYKYAYEEDLKGKKVIITPVHKDIYNNRETLSVVSFIKNSNDKIIGCVVLNAYMDNFTKYMEELYGQRGVVKIYVKLPNGMYYNNDGIKSYEDISKNKNSLIVKSNDFIFDFNKKKTLIHQVMNDTSKANLIILSIFSLFTIGAFWIIKRRALNPLINNISKLKKILHQINEYDEKEFENKKGFDQLDFIVGAFDSAINEKAKEYIFYDSLTKLPSRKGLEEIFDKEVEKGSSFALIFIDLNKFKNINDMYGHPVGDNFLQEFSYELSKLIGDRGVLTRVSGDEFIILYRDFVNDDELRDFYEKKILKIIEHKKLLRYGLEISFSAGVAVYPKDGKDIKTLIKKSDYMMYTNKKKGVFYKLGFFDKDVYKEIERRDFISMELNKAIDKNELFMMYQPIVDREGKVNKAEALIRWKNESLGFVPPMEFIEIAEKNREIIKIGYWIFDTVCGDIRNLIKINKDLVVNINVSSIQLLEKGFADNVKNIVDINYISPKNLCIEITESVMIEEDETSIKNLNKLREMGFSLSLDDFGTGYTSFSYLKKFKGGSLKIDKSILDDAAQNNYGIINSIKDIGHELDFKVVVEGVETEEQFRALVNIECDFFQGYYFSRPISKEELESFILR